LCNLLNINYSQLDYLRDGADKYIFPNTDVSFTMFSLEQLPTGASQALNNILSRTTVGSIHIEPVPENYPISLRGILGRIEHRKVDYLGGFDKAVSDIKNVNVSISTVNSAHNPLMFPSLYILENKF
jgi:hypothetical protein